MPPTQLSAVHPSPKRKRDQPSYVPLLNTTLRTSSTPPRNSPTPSGGADSPRNVVADQLRGMTITGIQAIPMSPLSPADDVVRKKPKLEDMMEVTEPELETFDGVDLASLEKSQVRDIVIVKARQMGGAREIPETPQVPEEERDGRRIMSNIAALAQPTVFASNTADLSKESTSPSQTSKSESRSTQPRPRKKSPSPPLTSLTWQDSEITGHLADPSTDPDDDGTGLNGIGFRPTPALAYARAQKRKQQLMDWKSREAREARARRTERRRRGVGALGHSSREGTVERNITASDAELPQRAVRFAV